MNLKYNPNDRKIYTKSENNEEIVIEENLPSKPVLSPNKKKTVYIAPLEWEIIGKVYLVDLDNLEKEVIYEPKNRDITPKDLTWLNDDEIILILGYPYGTVAVGGDVYKLDIESGKINLLYEFPDTIQITNIQYENGHLLLEGEEYIDENYLQTRKYYKEVKV